MFRNTLSIIRFKKNTTYQYLLFSIRWPFDSIRDYWGAAGHRPGKSILDIYDLLGRSTTPPQRDT